MSGSRVAGPRASEELLHGRARPDGSLSLAGLGGAVLSLAGSRQAAARAVQLMDDFESAHGDEPLAPVSA